jgi:hypothetical protein
MPPTLQQEPEEASSRQMWFVVLRGLAGPGFIVGGLGVMSKDLFWPAVLIVYFGCFILYLETIFEPWLLRRSTGLQCSLIPIPLCIAAWFTLTVVVRNAPLELYSFALRNANHADGESIEGITWNSHFTDLRVAFTNETNEDYRDLDIAIQPDTWNFAAVVKNNLSRCEILPIENANQLFVTFPKSTKKFTSRVTKAGSDLETHDSAGNSYTSIGRDYGYRLKCASLPHKSTVTVVFATEAPNQDVLNKTPTQSVNKAGQLGGGVSEWAGAKSAFDLLTDRPNPRFVTLSGSYYLGIRPFTISRTIDVKDGD